MVDAGLLLEAGIQPATECCSKISVTTSAAAIIAVLPSTTNTIKIVYSLGAHRWAAKTPPSSSQIAIVLSVYARCSEPAS